jgi:cold shock protein
MKGTIKKITDRGFGFITPEGEDKDLFFHSNDLKGATFEELNEGDQVEFEMGESDKGPKATDVTRL